MLINYCVFVLLCVMIKPMDRTCQSWWLVPITSAVWIWVENHPTLLLQFSLQAEFFVEKSQVKD